MLYFSHSFSEAWIFLSHCCTLRTLFFVCTPTMHSCSLLLPQTLTKQLLPCSVCVASKPNLVEFYKCQQSMGGLAIQTRLPCSSFCTTRLLEPNTQRLFFFFWDVVWNMHKNQSAWSQTKWISFYSLSVQLSDFILYLHL